jgi:hypothetical protein
MLSLSDVKAGNYAAMVVFNLLKDNRNDMALEEIVQLFPSVLEVAAKESEFGYANIHINFVSVTNNMNMYCSACLYISQYQQT